MKKSTTKTYTVTPINSIEEVRNDYNYVYSHITDLTAPLKKETGSKEVQIVKYDKTMTTEEILADFKEKGLKPASPNALLGFMKEHADSLESYQWLVAPSSVFQDEGGDRCFLFVDRSGGGRGLSLVDVDDYWGADDGWVFLAEVTSTPGNESLEHSEPLPLTDEEAIAHLKANGYKITRTETKEVEY